MVPGSSAMLTKTVQLPIATRLLLIAMSPTVQRRAGDWMPLCLPPLCAFSLSLPPQLLFLSLACVLSVKDASQAHLSAVFNRRLLPHGCSAFASASSSSMSLLLCCVAHLGVVGTTLYLWRSSLSSCVPVAVMAAPFPQQLQLLCHNHPLTPGSSFADYASILVFCCRKCSTYWHFSYS